MSNLINKVKAALKEDPTTSSNTGPHGANTVDPGAGSDLDRRNKPASTMGSSPTGQGASTTASTHGSTNVGPHSSNLANKLDPLADSDMDHRNNPTSAMGSARSGYGSATTATTHGPTNVGPHSDQNASLNDLPRDAALVPPSAFAEHDPGRHGINIKDRMNQYGGGLE